ncbi:MAG: tRNA-dihydrouridine synthase, partial [Pseudomonadota bacterium]|nr:tRNA-dihydrouridine synthase [Pseudomonadota bacterium]
GATGRPWIAAAIESALVGCEVREPGRRERAHIVAEHLDASIRFHGEMSGVRLFRKHLSAYIAAAPWPSAPEARRAARSRLCCLQSPREIRDALGELWSPQPSSLAA